MTDQQQQLLEYVQEKHGEQVRKYTQEPYWRHPQMVAERVNRWVTAAGVYEIALCHDLFEDTKLKDNHTELTEFLLSIGYSMPMAVMITKGTEQLTDLYTKEAYPDMNRDARKRAEAQRYKHVHADVKSIKLADIIDNTITIVAWDPAFSRVYLPEMVRKLENLTKGHIRLYIEASYWVQYGIRKLGL